MFHEEGQSLAESNGRQRRVDECISRTRAERVGVTDAGRARLPDHDVPMFAFDRAMLNEGGTPNLQL